MSQMRAGKISSAGGIAAATRFLWVLAISLGLALPRAVADDSATILYPDAGGAYRGVFESIVQGIEDQRLRTRKIALRDDMSREEIASRVVASGSKSVIALGRQGLAAALELGADYTVFVGGISMQPNANKNLAGISLAPDPALVFSRLKNIAPAIKRIFVVYNSRNNEWLIKNAREDAAAAGLDLVTREVQDLREAAKAFQEIVTNADGRKDAIWLVNDESIFSEDFVLPFILKEAWNRSIPLVSNNVGHVKRGALFALFPDNYALGRSLAHLVMSNGPASTRGISPLRDVRVAVNLQTANHLALNLSYAQQRSFDLIFPTP